ncbi:MAG: hypothetical protein JNL42_09615 [Anaerolineae bacterium]|nr:hypothetical protein [Anaerolineae bacterium]
MRRLLILIGLVLLLLIGGGLTALLNASGGQVLPILQQVSAVDASPTTMLPWKANQFILMIGFILFNLVGMAVTIGIVLWFIDRGVRKTRAEAAASDKSPA